MASFDPKKQSLVGRAACSRFATTMRSHTSSRCSSRASAKGWGRSRPRRSSASASSALLSVARRVHGAGAQALQSHKRGPKTQYRRTAEVVRQVIRHRFLDPDASPEVIAQKLCQSGWEISIRSVQRVIEEYGLQKKTLSMPADR